MTKVIGDIDIDCRNRADILQCIDYIPAKRKDGSKHPTGIYCQDIPFDPVTGLAECQYDQTNYSKIDLLNLNVLKYFSSNEEIIQYLDKEPNWDLLKLPAIVSHLPQIHDHFDLIQEIEPQSVYDLIIILNKIRENSQYKFKKSHALAYALNIIVLLNYFEDVGTIPEIE